MFANVICISRRRAAEEGKLRPPLRYRLGPDRHMKMLGHQNPADKQEMQFLPHLLQPLDKAAAKPIRKEEWRAAIGAGSDKLELTSSVNAVVEGHGGGEYTPHSVAPEENVPSGDRRLSKARVCASRPTLTLGEDMLDSWRG